MKAKPKQRRKSALPTPGQARGGYGWWLAVGVVAIAAVGLAVWASRSNAAVPVYSFRVVNQYPHDPDAYCQGLIFHQGVLYEGTGKYGQSKLRKVELQSGRVLQQVELNRRLFGEGITLWGDKLVQLTWKENVALVYDVATLRQTNQFRYTGEGWGLTHDGKHLIVSDGTPTLRFLDPPTGRVVRRLTVRDGNARVRNLNELEYVEGEILANVWYKDYLVRISPRTGKVTGYIDLRGLWPASQRPDREAVLNGIAYDAQGRRLFVTGKNWPRLYEIQLIPPSGQPE